MPDIGLVGVFASVDDLMRAGREIRKKACRIASVYAPFRFAGIDELIPAKASAVRLLTLTGAVIGGVGLVVLAVWAHLSFRFITSGKPVLPWIVWVVLCFEGVILGGSLLGFFSWIFLGRMPRFSFSAGYDPRFARDRFGMLVRGSQNDREDLRQALYGAGAEEVLDVS